MMIARPSTTTTTTRMMAHNVLALDISKACTGVAIGDGSDAPFVCAWRFGRHDATGAVCAEFGASLRSAIVEHNVTAVVAESPFVARHDSAAIVRIKFGMSVIAETIAYSAGLRWLMIAPATWRKIFTGVGRPKDAKTAAMLQCDRLGWDVARCTDIAEAAGVWCAAHLLHGNTKGMHRMLSESSMRRFE